MSENNDKHTGITEQAEAQTHMTSLIGSQDFTGLTVLVAGLGLSGSGVVHVLRDHGVHVLTLDDGKKDADVRSDSPIDWNSIDLLVVSPVFPPSTPFILEAQKADVPVWSEIEFAWHTRSNSTATQAPAPWVGVTGTDGKTTTTEMISAMLTAAGKKAPAVGNIGVSASESVQDASADHFVVELSSFALHFTHSLHLDTAVWTNVSPDHLDWHGGFDNYARDKSTVFRQARRAIVFNADDRVVSRYATSAHTQSGCQRVGFTLGKPRKGQIGVDGGWIVDRSTLSENADDITDGRVVRLAVFSDALKRSDGSVFPHLLADTLAATGAALSQGVSGDAIRKALANFVPDPHRLQRVASYKAPGVKAASREIRFIDDSKATDILASQASLSAFPDKSVLWICGGLAKGATFNKLLRQYGRKIKAAAIIGKDRTPFVEAFDDDAPDVPYVQIQAEDGTQALRESIESLMSRADPGDVVLLAPAAASMDQFPNYVVRGDIFATLAKKWVADHTNHTTNADYSAEADHSTDADSAAKTEDTRA